MQATVLQDDRATVDRDHPARRKGIREYGNRRGVGGNAVDREQHAAIGDQEIRVSGRQELAILVAVLGQDPG